MKNRTFKLVNILLLIIFTLAITIVKTNSDYLLKLAIIGELNYSIKDKNLKDELESGVERCFKLYKEGKLNKKNFTKLMGQINTLFEFHKLGNPENVRKLKATLKKIINSN